MGAKSQLLLLLVAFLICIGFALMPATVAETSHQVESILHQNAKIENHIEISIQNDLNEELPCSLAIDVFSEDLQEQIEMDSSNLVFSIEGLQTYYTNFSFTIPRSGNYLFNLTLLSNDDGVISSSSIEHEYLFYDKLESNLEEIIIDYYLDDEISGPCLSQTNAFTFTYINSTTLQFAIPSSCGNPTITLPIPTQFKIPSCNGDTGALDGGYLLFEL